MDDQALAAAAAAAAATCSNNIAAAGAATTGPRRRAPRRLRRRAESVNSEQDEAACPPRVLINKRPPRRPRGVAPREKCDASSFARSFNDAIECNSDNLSETDRLLRETERKIALLKLRHDSSAQEAQEQSNALYFTYWLELRGSIDALAIVMEVKERSADAMLCDTGLKVRLYFNDTVEETTSEYTMEHDVPTVRITWTERKIIQVGENEQQTFACTELTQIRVHEHGHRDRNRRDFGRSVRREDNYCRAWIQGEREK
ncbi:unnamed protein product [Trichogramma brassicae]|uniref:DIS3L2 C-terminal domain-containing protein n=1 Tax=Trichogramma brassicae TaxID=86971 RepID=A0A6H5ILR9_9HYME|nr:unnamed protein product [Trichogramma brassicae]